MSFVEIQFPPTISRGSSGGPTRLTDVVVLRSGFERRNAIWSNSRRRYDAGLGIRNSSHLYDAYEFFEARQGRLFGFRWKDWLDFKSCRSILTPTNTDQNIGVGDGVRTVFQLRKAYTSGSTTIFRDIRKPVAGTVIVAVNSSPTTVSTNTTTGMITFSSAPAAAAVITAGFEFDVPARFDQDELMVSLDLFDAGDVPDLKVIEVRV